MITDAGCWGIKKVTSRQASIFFFKLFECFFIVPSKFIAPVNALTKYLKQSDENSAIKKVLARRLGKVKDRTKSLKVVQASYDWRSDSTITLQSFANGIEPRPVPESTSPSESVYRFILKAMKSFFCLYFAECQNYCFTFIMLSIHWTNFKIHVNDGAF